MATYNSPAPPGIPLPNPDMISMISNHISPTFHEREAANTATVQGHGSGVEHPQIALLPQNPRVPLFSGFAKADCVSYEQWLYEVQNLLSDRNLTYDAVNSAARRSLRGDASRVAMRLGPGASLRELFAKLEGIYGQIEAADGLLEKFYSAEQKPSESVVEWGCRLEDLLDKVGTTGKIDPSQFDNMLRSKFWSGLHPHLKDASRHRYESGCDFDTLRVALRRIENEIAQRQKHVKPNQFAAGSHGIEANAIVSQSDTQGKKELSDMTTSFSELKQCVLSMEQCIKDMNLRLGKVEQNVNSTKAHVSKVSQHQNMNQSPRPTRNGMSPIVCWACGSRGHRQYECPQVTGDFPLNY